MLDEVSDGSKATIRRRVRARRAAMTPAERALATAHLTERLITLTEERGARSIACYSPVPSEPDTGPFLAWAVAQGIEVLLPVALEGSVLDWARYTGGGSSDSSSDSSSDDSSDGATGLTTGRHGITEPTGPRLGGDAAGRTQLMLVPACAVDNAGTRLGWGMGYYDRCLAELAAAVPVYAVVFDADRYPRLPRDPHDVPVTGAVSPGATTRVHSGTS